MNKRRIFKPFFNIVAKILYRVKIIGEENIPETGSYILCGNHVHALDAPVIIVTAKRKIRFMAKEELQKNKIISFFAKVFEVIPVKRGTADLDAIKLSMKAIKDGDILGIFPEGTRNGMAKHSSIKAGAAFMALKTNTPVIPVGIQGTFKPFTKVVINYGKPIDFSKYAVNKGKPDKEHLEIVSEKIMEEIVKLRDNKEIKKIGKL